MRGDTNFKNFDWSDPLFIFCSMIIGPALQNNGKHVKRSDSSISTVIATSSFDISSKYTYLVLVVCSGASSAVGAGEGGDGVGVSLMKILALFK